MKHHNKNRMLAGVFAVLFVLQTSAMGLNAFAEETDTAVLTAAETVLPSEETTEAATEAPTEPATEAASENLTPVAGDTDPETPPMPTDNFTPIVTQDDKIALSGAFTMPDQIYQGSDVDVIGFVTSSNTALTTVTVGVYNTTTGFVTGDTRMVNKDFCDISAFDESVKFSSLTPGIYQMVVIASNGAKTNETLMNKQFEVKAAAADVNADSIGIVGASEIPTAIKTGTPVSVRGIVTSNISNLEAVSVVVYTETLQRVTGASARPLATTYDISRLDSLVSFNTLKEGKYIYRVIATNGSNMDFTVQEAKFEVTAGTVPAVAVNDTLTAANVTQVPDTHKMGSIVNIKGTVTSAVSNITYLTCGVYDVATTRMVTGRTVAPSAKTYDLSRIDDYIAFDKLPAGEYVFAVIASNAANSNYALVNKKFTVSANGSAAVSTSDAITATGLTQIPDTLAKGTPVSVRGTVTSAVSNITQVTVSVTDAAGGGWMTGKTVNVNTKSYNLANLDQYVMFNKLPDGVYNYNVLVTNAANSQYVAYTKKFTVGTGVVTPQTSNPETDTMLVNNMFTMPDSIKLGQTVSVSGTVFSKETNITALTVGVYDSTGAFRTGKTIQDLRTSIYDLRNLDRYVTFNSLPAGEYTFAVIASNGSRTNEALYTKKFTVGTVAGTTSDKLTLTGIADIQGNLKYGVAVNVTGTLTSETSNLTSVTVGVFDTANKLVTGKTVAVNAKTFDLKTLDNDVAFNKLAVGDYVFHIIASNGTKTNEYLYTSRFSITKDGQQPASTVTTDTLTLTNASTIPDSIKQGTAVSVAGNVTSAASNITALTCGVYNSAGQFVTGKTIAPNAKTYNLKNLDYAVEFNKLATGTYTYAVIASNAANSNYTVLSKKFTVTDANGNTVPNQNTTQDDLTITGGTVVPATLAVGQVLGVQGTVTSATNMTALTVGVYDTAGNFRTGKTINPAAKTYNLKNLDYAVEFNKLPAGSYVYAVIVTNGTKSNYAVVNKSFTIGSGTSTPIAVGSDNMAISGGTTVPATIKYGRPLNVFGTVTSGTSNMTALTCGVYDTNGKFITGKTINPNAKSYDLKKLDAFVSFNTLPVGNYVYAVIATNASHSNYTLVSQKFSVYNEVSGTTNPTTPSTDTIALSGGTSVPSLLTKGKTVIVRGNVTSYNPLTSVIVGVYDANGRLVTGGEAKPNATYYNLNGLDSAVRFDQLAAGTYYYRVTASSTSKSNISLFNQYFVVQ